jgi:hypothetical protein
MQFGSRTGRVNTAQGTAMPRSICSPSGTSGGGVSAATVLEISADRPAQPAGGTPPHRY